MEQQTIAQLVSALDRAGVEDGAVRKLVAEKLYKHLTPKVRRVEETVDHCIFDITSSIDAGLFCGLTTGNPKLAYYAWPYGKQSGLVRFGQCDRLIGEALGETLLEIVSIAFIRQVALDDTVRLTVKFG